MSWTGPGFDMIDLRSDTVTRPTDEMREAARDAAVGDDVYGEDPTVNELEDRAAELLGTDAALYVPSGTMGNQIAALTHAEHGQEVVVEADSHVYGHEVGGLAATAGLQVRPIDGGDDGLYSRAALADAIVEPSLHRAGTGLVCLENTHNRAGGRAHSPGAMAARCGIAHDAGVPVHLDGARLFNAAVALDVTPAALVDPVDSVMCCVSKGLGAPVGSLLAGEEDFVATARRHRKRLGGGMRQAGIIAAPGLIALESWERLAEDHERAARLAAALDELPGVAVDDPDTNLVRVDLTDAAIDGETFLEGLAELDVLAGAYDGDVIRLCTHRDLTDADVDAAIDAATEVLAG